MSSVAPCAHPRCKDSNGDPYLTRHGMCEPCQRRLRDTLWYLVLDWVELVTKFPTARRGNGERRSTHRTYGHPAEWASDTAARIADVLNETHDALADHLAESPAPHSGVAERRRIEAAWRYLECRIDKFAKWDGAKDVALGIIELHGEIRSKLGYTRVRQLLPVPCPRCELKTVTRQIDYGVDQVQCESCGYTTDQKHYGLLSAMILDALISADELSRQVLDTPKKM